MEIVEIIKHAKEYPRCYSESTKELIGYLESQQEEIERLKRNSISAKNVLKKYSEENQKLREVLDSNEYISFIRKSLTNAECRRYWKQLLNK